ncbi:MAG TPA: flagellar basal body P-ring formation protein FlgA [Firmicutes bacterium]|nr:flagellar basal body P-ring formation protein FlgA [Bacillota bacterium]
MKMRTDAHTSLTLTAALTAALAVALTTVLAVLLILAAGAAAREGLPPGLGTPDPDSDPDTSGAPALVILKPRAVTTGPDIRLEEIADLVFAPRSGTEAAGAGQRAEQEDMLQKLSALAVGRAALPGNCRLLNSGSIRVRLRQAGIADRDVRIDGAAETEVCTAALVVTRPEMEAAIQRAVAALYPAGYQVVVSCPALPSAIKTAGSPSHTSGGQAAGGAAGGAFEIEAQVDRSASVVTAISAVPAASAASAAAAAAAAKGGGGDGAVTVSLAIKEDGTVLEQLTTRCSAGIFAEVALTAGRLERHTVLLPELLLWERRDLTYFPGAVTKTDAGRLLGMRLAKPLSSGSVLRWTDIEPVPDAQMNHQVQLIYSRGAVWVADAGRLLADAVIGEKVSVINIRTGKLLQGILINADQVLIGDGGS